MDHRSASPPAAAASPGSPPAREGPLVRWARFAVRRRGAVLGGWVVLLALLGGLAATVGGEFVDSFEIPGAESQQALDLLTDRFPAQSGDRATIVFRAEAGVTAPAVQPRIDALVAGAAGLPEVVGAIPPSKPPAPSLPTGGTPPRPFSTTNRPTWSIRPASSA